MNKIKKYINKRLESVFMEKAKEVKVEEVGTFIDSFIFRISAIVRDNFSDTEVIMEKARKEVNSLLKAERSRIVGIVEGMKAIEDETFGITEYGKTYNQALDDILKAIK